MGCASMTSSKEAVISKEGVVRADSDAVNIETFYQEGVSYPVELHLSGQKLVKLDKASNDDAMAVVYLRNSPQESFKEVSRTEVIIDSNNPEWTKKPMVRYMFETTQYLKVELYDVDDPKNVNGPLKNHDYIGYVECTIPELLRSPKSTKVFNIQHPTRKENGNLTIRGEELKSAMSSSIAFFRVSIDPLRTGTKRLFFKIYRKNDEGADYTSVYQSECSNNGKFRRIKIGAATLFRDKTGLPLKIEYFEYKSNGNHVKLGALVPFSWDQLQDNSFKFDTAVGLTKIDSVEFQKRASFLEFLQYGLNISLIVAIDFTGSNGSPDMPNSLHSQNLNNNQYLSAIRAVGNVVQEYDSDRNIPVFGYGAKIPSIPKVLHQFALNGNIFAPEVYTVASIEALYIKNLMKVDFSGPTWFAPVINYVADMAKYYSDSKLSHHYFVLLIITDGAINDMKETIDAVIKCSRLPVSIIIVGVGNDNFASMNELDSDQALLKSRTSAGVSAERDIVQFVNYKEVQGNPPRIASETLKELPSQITEYYMKLKLEPRDFRIVPGIAPYYEARKAMFFQQVAQTGVLPDNIYKLLNVGFPTEDIQTFVQCLSTRFENALAG